jgi:3-deoxy-7-phosphoheptulonate synthase
VKDVIQRRIQGEVSLAGVMVESYLREGKQTLPVDLSCMQKEISVTDACLGFDDTEFLLRDIEKSLAPLFPPPVV